MNVVSCGRYGFMDTGGSYIICELVNDEWQKTELEFCCTEEDAYYFCESYNGENLVPLLLEFLEW